MGRAQTNKKLRRMVRQAARRMPAPTTTTNVPMNWSHWGNWFHASARISNGKAPMGLGLRVFAWKPQEEFVFTVSILIGPLDLQFGVHV